MNDMLKQALILQGKIEAYDKIVSLITKADWFILDCVTLEKIEAIIKGQESDHDS